MYLRLRRRDLRTHLYIATVIKFLATYVYIFLIFFLIFLLDLIIVTINLVQLLAAILIRINYLSIYLSPNWLSPIFLRIDGRKCSSTTNSSATLERTSLKLMHTPCTRIRSTPCHFITGHFSITEIRILFQISGSRHCGLRSEGNLTFGVL